MSKVLRQKEKYLLPESQRSPRKRGKEISLQHTLAVWVQRQEQERGELPSDAAILQQARTLAAALPALADSQLAFHEPDWLNKFKAEWKDHWAENPDGSYASLGRHESSSSSVPVSRDVRDLGHSKEVKRPDTPRAYQVMKAPDQAASRSNPGQTFAFEYKKPGRSPPQLHSPVIENNGRPHSPSPWPYSSYSPATQCPSDQLPPYAQTYPPPAGSGSATWPPPYPYNQPQWQGSSQYPSYPRPPPPPLKSPPAITETTTQLAKRELEPSTPSGDLPTYDQAQEALQTLQRYIRHFQSSLQQNEKELIQRLDAVKLKPSLPDLPKHSTGTELGASKRKIKRAKSQHLK